MPSIAEATPARESLGLPRDGFVFCCFNKSYKILPAAFDAWMRILRAVPGSVLWLSGNADAAVKNLRSEAARAKAEEDYEFFFPNQAGAEGQHVFAVEVLLTKGALACNADFHRAPRRSACLRTAATRFFLGWNSAAQPSAKVGMISTENADAWSFRHLRATCAAHAASGSAR